MDGFPKYLLWSPDCDDEVPKFWLILSGSGFMVEAGDEFIKFLVGCGWGSRLQVKSIIVVGLVAAGEVSFKPWSPGGAGGPPTGAPATEEPLPPGWEMRWD